MEDNPSASGKGVFNPLQPVYELIQGADPDLVCIKYGISRTQLDKMTSAYQASRREAAVAGCFTASKTNRNDPCPCGSGKKYKKCCLPGHEEARRLLPKEQLKQMGERAKAREKVEREVRKGFELIFSLEYERADQYARKQIETFPEDDRFYDILLSACFALGDYDAAFQIARKRWQTAVEEKLFFQENGYHKREGVDRDRHVHFYSPSTWLEKFWIAQRARTWREQYPQDPGGSPPSARGDFASAQPGHGASPLKWTENGPRYHQTYPAWKKSESSQDPAKGDPGDISKRTSGYRLCSSPERPRVYYTVSHNGPARLCGNSGGLCSFRSFGGKQITEDIFG